MELTVDGKLYRISPSGLVWSGYRRPSQPELGVLWRRMERGTIPSMRVLRAAGLIAPKAAGRLRSKERYYADRHCI